MCNLFLGYGIIQLDSEKKATEKIVLLSTKVTLPPQPAQYVRRERLLQKVAAFPEARLILTCAPAGFGKSSWVLAYCHHLKAANAQVAWYALDRQDNDPARFAAYLMRAFCPDDAQQIGEDQRDLEDVVTLIMNRLVQDSGHYVFALDDYHLITNPTIHHCIALMLEHLPVNGQVLIGTRADPPLPLSRLRARGQIVELRAADLRFTSGEIKTFVQQAARAQLSDQSLRELEIASEGWITALWLIRLAAESMGQKLDDEAIAQHLNRFSTAQRHIFDYFADEVFDQQPAELQQFLLDTCVLNRLFPDICVVLTGNDNGSLLLDDMARSSLFLIPLSDHEPVYRYHHLFEDFLRNRLRLADPERFQRLHQRAAEWHQAHGNVVEAVDHALTGAAYDEAAWLIKHRAWEALTAHGEIMTMLSWLPAFPEPVLKAHPRLCLYFSRALYLTGDFEQSQQLVQMAAREIDHLPEDAPETAATRGIVYNYQATLAAYQGDLTQGFAFIERASKQWDKLDPVSQVRVANTRAYLHFLQGDSAAACRAYEEALTLAQQADHHYLTIDAVYFLAQLDVHQGRLLQAQARCEDQLEQQARRIAPISALLTVLARVHYEQNRPVEAEVMLRDAAHLARRGHISEILWLSYTLLAVMLAAQGQPEEAEDFACQADAIAQQFDSPPVKSIVAAATARVMLLTQRLDEAAHWARDYQQSAPVEFMRDYEELTLARVWIAQGKPDSVLPHLDNLIGAAGHAGRAGSVLEAQLLQALAFQADGQTEQALGALEHVLRLAAVEGYVRLFLDEGPPMVRLLRRAVEHNIVPDYAGRLLREAEKESRRTHPADVLTDRELEVLELVAEGATNQDIADSLVISLGTVKSHVNHIMGKLDAQNRTEAVAKAQSLGILDA